MVLSEVDSARGGLPSGKLRAKWAALRTVLGAVDEEAASEGADRLLKEFGGSLARIFAAREARLTRVLGNAAAARHLKACRHVLAIAAREPLERRPVLSGWSALMDYLAQTMAHDPIERVRVVYLDAGSRLIADEVMSEGTVDYASFPVREIVTRALDIGATSMVIVHNHPSGRAEPSRQDVAVTRRLIDACRPLSIDVHDHVVVAAGGHVSLRCRGLL